MDNRDKSLEKIQFEGATKNTVKFSKINMHMMQLKSIVRSWKSKANFAFLQLSFQRTMKFQISLNSHK